MSRARRLCRGSYEPRDSTIVMPYHATAPERLQSLFGLVVFTFLAFLIGRVRGGKTIPWRVIIWGTILQFAFGAAVLFAPHVLETIQYAIQRVLDFTLAGVDMIFGSLAGHVDAQGQRVYTIPVFGV